ncbi:MAG TPA: efflux RND transporter permease subunit, partial [Gammaproteobacteria bacterium]|nr:efflux RND transporter permease subunit [Gammaproteobacteria bacterium]
VKQEEGQLVRLKEVAKVTIEPATERFLARYNTNETVALGIVKQSTANPLEIAQTVEALLPQLSANMPKGMHIEIAYDSTLTIKNSIESVFKTLFEAVILVIFVIFVFLRSMRATLIPLITIPISLISAFAIMAAFNFSINTLTLLAMVLAIGLVVDDAIVVLENIHRHVESGLSPLESARKGMKEIGFAVIAMTLTLLAVFAPIAFSRGYVGKLFTEFAIVLSGSVVVSGVTALTLSPMMCSRLLKPENSHGRVYLWIERFLEGLSTLYARTLKVALNHTIWVLGIFIVVLALNYFLFTGLKSELAPPEDRGFIIAIGMAPQGSSVHYTNKYAKQMEQVLANNPNIQRFFTIIGYPNVTQTMSFAMLPSHDKRDVSQFEVTEQLNKHFWGISGLASFAINPPSSIEGGGSRGDVAFVIQSPKGFEDLGTYAEIILNKARQNPKLLNLDIDFKLDKPQIELHVNRERAAMLGVDLSVIGQTLQVLYGGKKASTYSQGSQQYDVLVQADSATRQTPESIHSVYVRSKNNTMIPLASLVEPKETVAANALNRFNKLPAAVITAALSPDYTLQEALSYFEALTQEVNSAFLIDYAGASRTFKQSVNTLAQAFILALLVIFLVLAAQFESFKSPFIIMLSVPCAIFGALLILSITEGSLNIFSQIGLITLIGLITKHGILLVEFTQQLRQQGLGLQESLLESARLRFRPILMTTAATVLGALPLAIATGAGAEGRNQIGWVIVGGMLIGTLFTLFIVPAIYKIFSKKTVSVTSVDKQGDLA